MKKIPVKYVFGIGLLVVITIASKTFSGQNLAFFGQLRADSPNSNQQVALKMQASAEGSTNDNNTVAIIEHPLVATTKSLSVATLKCAPRPPSGRVVNVMAEGAVGNGKTDDTQAIQNAIDKVAGSGGIVLIPGGTYLIDAVTHLKPKSDMTLKMEQGAVLKAMPNNKENYGIITIKNVANVNIIGGIVQGERDQHQGKTGEWGMGVELYGSKNVVIENVISKDNWGDGFYINDEATNTSFCGVVADNNRRQGMSVISADGILVQDSVFQRTNGTEPMAGIDIEPNKNTNVSNVRILNNLVMHNEGSGIVSSVSDDANGSASVKNVVIDSNTVVNNGKIGAYSAGIYLNRQVDQKVTNNTVSNNFQDGIGVVSESTRNLIRGNTTNSNGNHKDIKFGSGILTYKASGNFIENNSAHSNVKFDILDFNGKNSVKTNNAGTVKSGWP